MSLFLRPVPNWNRCESLQHYLASLEINLLVFGSNHKSFESLEKAIPNGCGQIWPDSLLKRKKKLVVKWALHYFTMQRRSTFENSHLLMPCRLLPLENCPSRRPVRRKEALRRKRCKSDACFSITDIEEVVSVEQLAP